MKTATITIDKIAEEFFPKLAEKTKGYLEILEKLQRNLRGKGNDPRYQRVVFAVEGQDKYLIINEGDISLAGVFPRVSGRRYECHSKSIESLFAQRFVEKEKSVLVVANNQKIALQWEEALSSLGYELKQI